MLEFLFSAILRLVLRAFGCDPDRPIGGPVELALILLVGAPMVMGLVAFVFWLSQRP